MKKPNSISDFTSERNALLIEGFHLSLSRPSQSSIDRLFREAAEMPAPRFWVSEHRAAVVIAAMLKSDDNGEAILNEMYEEKREMYREIYRRVLTHRADNPGLPLLQSIFEVVNQPAPRSYISWQRARSIIYKEKRRRRLERSIR